MAHRSVPDVLHPAVEKGRLAEHGRHVGRVVEVEVRRRKIALKKDGIADTYQNKLLSYLIATIYTSFTKVFRILLVA